MSRIRPEDAEWRQRAERIIAAIAKAAYGISRFRADGTRIKNPQAYRLPPQVDVLVRALAFNNHGMANEVFRELRVMAMRTAVAQEEE